MQEWRNGFHLTETENINKRKWTRVKQYKRKSRWWHKKENSQNTKKIIIQKRREKTASNNRKKVVVQKKYNAYLSHLSIMDYDRVGLWMCALEVCKRKSEFVNIEWTVSMQVNTCCYGRNNHSYGRNNYSQVLVSGMPRDAGFCNYIYLSITIYYYNIVSIYYEMHYILIHRKLPQYLLAWFMHTSLVSTLQ